MIYSLLADALLVIHLLFIVFVVLGGLLVLKWFRIIYLHLPAVSWGILVEFNHWICPLTYWENSLRHAAGEASYDSGFIEHYLIPIIYPANLTNETQIMLGLTVILVNILIYSLLFIKIRNR